MRFRTKDIVIGLVIIAIVIAAALLYKNLKTPKVLPTPTPSTTKEDIQGMFNYQVPENVESIELKDVTGGTAKAIATRNYENGTFTHEVLADLPDLKEGFYEGWLVMGDKYISTGKLRVAKGGYLLDFSSVTDYSDYTKVVVTKELVNDQTPELHVLEGSF